MHWLTIHRLRFTQQTLELLPDFNRSVGRKTRRSNCE
jgi:hypothetical protein